MLLLLQAWEPLCTCPAHTIVPAPVSPPSSFCAPCCTPAYPYAQAECHNFTSTPQIILNAKCHAIRDAQMLEKKLIQKELDAEEKRLDQMMEVERQKSIQRQEELDRKRREERIR